MQISKNINIDFDAIPVEEFWNTGDIKENRMHRIHAYPAKFPAFITSKAIDYAENYNQNINWVADMFCGCGTTAYEATRNGKNFWGSDINPVATLIAKTKSQVYIDSILVKYYDTILISYQKISISRNDLKEINERIWYWFKEEQIADLLKLKFSIYQSIPLKSKYLNFFLTAFSNILKPTSKWLTKSIKPQIDPNKKPADVLIAFSKQFDIMGDAISKTKFLSFLRQLVAKNYDESGKAKLFASRASEWSELLGNLECDFSEKHSITTREWFYEGKTSNLDLLETQIKLAIEKWMNAVGVDEPRGTVIYCYVEQSFDPEYVSQNVKEKLFNMLKKYEIEKKKLELELLRAKIKFYERKGAEKIE